MNASQTICKNHEGEYLFKLSLLGDGKVGKSSLCQSLETGRIPGTYDITVGLNISAKGMNIEGTKVKLILWDLAGQERFDCMRESFYEGSHVGAVVFDVTNRGSFYDINQWIREFRAVEKTAPLILIGNKIDVPGREVTKDEALELAEKYNIQYIETSAKTGQNVAQAFADATSLALKRALKGTDVAY